MKKYIRIHKERCKGCMLCVDVCPKHILKATAEVNKKGLQTVVLEDKDKCTGCGLCRLMCPDCVIEIIEE